MQSLPGGQLCNCGILWILACLWALPTPSSSRGEPSIRAVERRPNVVLILADDLGYGDPGCYNSESKIPTPHLDRLAREGLRFTDAHAPDAYCIPTRYGLLTGCYPSRTVLRIEERPGLAEGQTTLGTMLQTCGYRTHMVGKWHLGFEGGQNQAFEGVLQGGPLDHGFHSFFGIHASLDIPPYFVIRDRRAEPPPTDSMPASASPDWSPIQGAFWRAGRSSPAFQHADLLPRLESECLQILDHATPDQPFFLYVALTAPHTPWLPSPAFQGQSGAGVYGDFVMQTDAVIGQILNRLQDRGLTDHTLVIVTSDNGPVWYPNDRARYGHSATGPWRGMKSDSFEGGHRIPLLVRWPQHIPPNTTSSALACHTDIMATLAQIVDVPLPAIHDSVSLLPIWQNPQHPDVRDHLVLRKESSVIRRGPWKLITHLGSGGFTSPRDETPTANGPRGQLYNLATDPGETTNLWLTHPELVRQLTELVPGS